eukprot:TRINITY_DN9260_c0_g1_i1.p1 TRINITY_DN9260_c0_g1~~TRINITY_DN9260_c0_g1_i1.p1  ORF type:complete len:646 (-),score=81.52 TRINITY_DN9260_c0_g1_i1:81-2018(-)
MPETLYELLGVGPDALLSELRASYKRRMLEVHPDKGGTVERCQRVIAAFELLANPAARQLYDARLANSATSRCHAKSKRRTSPRVARAAQAAGHDSPSRPDQPDDAGVTASPAKKARVFAADGLSGASARSDIGLGANSSSGNAFSRGGYARNSYVAPSPKILVIMIRVVRLLRRLPRDARRDFIGRSLSESQRQAIEKFMLSEAQKAAASGSVTGDRMKQESATCASSVSSDESPCSEDDRSDDDEQLLALCHEPNESAEVEATDTEDEQEDAEKVETEEIGMEVGDSEDEKDENEAGEDDEQVDERGRVAATARLRGIIHHSQGFYVANIGFACMRLSARCRRSLERALDDHILLVAIKARMTIWSPDSHGELKTPQRMFEDELRSAIPEVLEENGINKEQFHFTIRAYVPTKYWIGRPLMSPTYTQKSLDTALHFWRCFREARGERSVGGGGMLARYSPAEAAQIWGRVREVYLEAWAQRGANVCLLCEKLDALEAANAQSCRRKVERWEGIRMQREERSQRAMVRALILATSRARQQEKRERVAMRKEDKLRQHWREVPVLDRIGRLLSLWVRELEKIQKRKARFHAREFAAARQRSAAARHSAEKARLRASHVQREQRWRWLRRQDLTMEEILRGCPFEQ